jgi:hypothetical protein
MDPSSPLPEKTEIEPQDGEERHSDQDFKEESVSPEFFAEEK